MEGTYQIVSSQWDHKLVRSSKALFSGLAGDGANEATMACGPMISSVGSMSNVV